MRIKCPHCNGKGVSEINSALNMTCGWCMGKGELDLEIVPTEPQTEAEIEKKWENTVWDTDVYLDDIDGKEPMTNEEWFCQLPTEEKARWLYDHYVNARADEYYGRQEKTLSEYQKWLVSVHMEIDGTKID